jgi:uncharacterized damage-inducible protein DinB
MAARPSTEVWQRGPVAGYHPLLMPVVHALLQVQEDVEHLATTVPAEQVWVRPGGAASIAFHLRHTAGALDRLLTYARGEALSTSQREALAAEEHAAPAVPLATIADEVNTTIERALAQVRATSPESLTDERRVGRAGLPSTVIGLLFHAAEHSTRHVGQAITTARILDGRG